MCRIVHILWQILFIICIDNNILFHPKATTWGAFSCIKIPDRFFSKWKTPIRPRMCNMCKNECESRVCFAFSGRKSLFFFWNLPRCGGVGDPDTPSHVGVPLFSKAGAEEDGALCCAEVPPTEWWSPNRGKVGCPGVAALCLRSRVPLFRVIRRRLTPRPVSTGRCPWPL